MVSSALLLTLDIYGVPSQSLWRACELSILRELKDKYVFERPILEIGCGNGAFSALLFDSIDDGIDMNPRAIENCRQYGLYQRLHWMDARQLSFPSSTYKTVFANCVIEHIQDLPHVFSDSRRVLAPEGWLVDTVPF